MSNFTKIDSNTISYQITSNQNFQNDSFNFVIDPTLMPGSACYDSNSSEKVIKYNIDKYESIISIEHTFEQIYNQYISSGKLNIKNKEYGTWVNYNNDDEKYYIRFSYLFTIKTDYSTLPACKYFTTRFSEFPAKEYHYANKSSCDTCSHPTIVENSNNEISLCHYRSSLKSFSICPLYTEDILHTSSYKIKSKFSEETFVITSKAYRSNDSSKVIASIYQTLPDETEIVIQTISLDTLSGASYDDFFSNLKEITDEVLDAFCDTHIIDSIENNSNETSVQIQKKSYITSLV
jgi:hypothetical protein